LINSKEESQVVDEINKYTKLSELTMSKLNKHNEDQDPNRINLFASPSMKPKKSIVILYAFTFIIRLNRVQAYLVQ